MPKQTGLNENGALHPIAVVAARTGLSQDVLRVWERRYGAVQPARGPGGQRVYADADIERLRLLRLASAAGRSISQIATLPTPALKALVEGDEAAGVTPLAPDREQAPSRAVIKEAFSYIRTLDGSRLRATMQRALALMGITSFLDELAAPLLRQVGEGWHAGAVSVAQEHVASSVIHDVILDAMRGFVAPPGSARIVIATPSGERHVIGAAIAAVTAAAEGWTVIYLGADLPGGEIADAAVTTGAAAVAVSLIHVHDRARTLAELGDVRDLVPQRVPIFAGGSGSVALASDLERLNVRVIRELSELRTALQKSA